jgi:hypothetical protein
MLATANPASSQNVQAKAVTGIEVAANRCCKKIAKPVIHTGPPKRWQILIAVVAWPSDSHGTDE